MRRTVCFLAVIALLCGSCACADLHSDIKCVPAGKSGTAVTFDLYEQEGAVYTVSSLFPDHVYIYRNDSGISFTVTDFTVMLSQRSELAAAADTLIGSRFAQWIGKRLSEPQYGVWTGELFDRASSVRNAEFGIDELISFLDVQTDPQDPEGSPLRYVRLLAYKAALNLANSGMTVSVCSFDEGKYLSAEVHQQDDVIMTVSADCSESSAKHIRIIYREEGRYYFRDISFRCDGERFTAETALRSSDASSFAGAKDGLLFSETFTANDGTDQSVGFEWRFEAPALKDLLIVSGSAKTEGTDSARVDASVSIGEPGNTVLLISASDEPLARPVSFTDKEEVTADNKTGSDWIQLSATSGLMMIAAEIIPALPAPYQKIIWNLLGQ